MSSSVNMLKLLRNQELKQLINKTNQYHNIIHNFYNIYNSLAGDINNEFFNSNSTKLKLTSNDNLIDGYKEDEAILMWEHLYNAELSNFLTSYNNKKAGFTCNSDYSNLMKIPGENIPWIIDNKLFIYVAFADSNKGFITYILGNGKTCNNNNKYSENGILTNIEARKIYYKFYNDVSSVKIFKKNTEKSFDDKNLIFFSDASENIKCNLENIANNFKTCYVFLNYQIKPQLYH